MKKDLDLIRSCILRLKQRIAWQQQSLDDMSEILHDLQEGLMDTEEFNWDKVYQSITKKIG